MRAGYAAAVSAALAVVVVLAVLPYANLPYVPKATVTLTQTAWSTATETSTVTHTVTTTETETETTTKTTTAWRTETTTETKTQTLTETRTETQTITETLTITTTTTAIKEELNYYWVEEPNKIWELLDNANKSILAFITYDYPLGVKEFPDFATFLSKLINASNRGISVHVLIVKTYVCNIANNTVREWVINQINTLNATLPPGSVVTDNWGDVEGGTYPLADTWSIFKAYIDYEYLVGGARGWYIIIKDPEHFSIVQQSTENGISNHYSWSGC